MSHLRGRDGRVLTELGAQGGVRASQPVECQARRDQGTVLAGQLLVGSLDSAMQYPCAQAVAFTRLITEAAREDKVAGLAPLGGELVLAKQLRELGLKHDLATAGGGLGRRHGQQTRAQVEIAPAHVRQFAGSQPAGHDRRRQEHAVAARGTEQGLDLLSTHAGPRWFGLFEFLDPGLDRVVLDQFVAHRRVEDLVEPDQGLVDRSVGERPRDAGVLAFSEFCRFVAVDLTGRDLNEPVAVEERQQMMGEREPVILGRARRQLTRARCQPL